MSPPKRFDRADPPSSWTRPWQGIRWVIIVVGIAFAVHLVIPQVGELEQARPTLRGGSWWWLGLAAVASALTYPAAALGIIGSVPSKLSLWPTTITQVASSAATLAAPAGLGAVALNQRYLESQGVPRPAAAAGLSINLAVTAMFHVAAMAATAAILGITVPETAHLPPRRYLVDGAVILAVLTGVVLWSRPLRRRLIRPLVAALRSVPDLVGHPTRVMQLVGGAVLVNVAYIAALQASLASFGPAPDPVHTAFVYLVAAVVGTVTPTPGGVGGFEAALVAGLTRIGPTAGLAVAAALAFRILTFWLPILPGAVALRWLRKRRII